MQRRDFIISLSAAIGMIATGCKKPVHKLAPLVLPDALNQTGSSIFYNTVYPHYGIPYSIRVKTREGRPIKIDANPDCLFNNNGTNATIQASIYSLYDPARFIAPTINGKNTKITDAFKYIKNLIKQKSENKKILIISQTINSPLFNKLIEKISNTSADINFLQFPISNEDDIPLTFFKSINNTRKKIIVSLGADILGSSKYSLMFQNTLFSGQNRDNIKIITAEPYLTQTGISSDERELRQIRELEILASIVFDELNKKHQHYSLSFPVISTEYNYLYNSPIIKAIRENNVADFFIFAGDYLSEMTKKIVNKINVLYHSSVKQNYNKQIKLLKELVPSTHLVIFLEFNPYYSNHEISALIDKIPQKDRISISQYYDETALKSGVHIPASNYLENWELYNYFGDDIIYIQQPVVSKLNINSISPADFLLNIFNYKEDITDYYTFLRENLNTDENLWISSLQKGYINDRFFNFAHLKNNKIATLPAKHNDSEYNVRIKHNIENLQLLTVPSLYNYTGIEPNNPFLLELSHPLSKLTWGNAVFMNYNTAKKFSIKQGDIVSIQVRAHSIELPVLLCESCADDLLVSEYGFGNKIKNGLNTYGQNIYKICDNIFNNLIDVIISKTGKTIDLPIADGKQNIELPVGKDFDEILKIKNKKEQNCKPQPSFKQTFEYLSTKWEMEIDLAKCTGCNACIVACQIENNIPVTGEQGIKEKRAMHWMKLNTYIINIQGDIKGEFEPLMCQHCDNAPCENVCPVSATTHSPEGINEMTYNRCIGSRYCIVNCPYEVRVFNFDNYNKNIKSPLELLLNPDVSVRSRGVSEKCTFCVHRIEEYERKKQLGNNPPAVQTACQQACPTGAINFGNILSKMFKINKDGYKLLEHLNTLPSITYISKFKNNE